jgi:hypothetical protein
MAGDDSLGLRALTWSHQTTDHPSLYQQVCIASGQLNTPAAAQTIDASTP